MKKLFAVSITLLVFTFTVFADVNKKLLYSFNKEFPSAENVKWTEDSAGYFVSFTQFNILSKIAYDQQGKFLYALRYYKEENLPVSIIMAIRKKFADKEIFNITELSTTDDITYYIKLQDSKNWYDVQTTASGTITIEDHFEKNDF